MGYLEVAYRNREPELARIHIFPQYAELRDDPRFVQLLQRLRLPVPLGPRGR